MRDRNEYLSFDQACTRCILTPNGCTNEGETCRPMPPPWHMHAPLDSSQQWIATYAEKMGKPPEEQCTSHCLWDPKWFWGPGLCVHPASVTPACLHRTPPSPCCVPSLSRVPGRRQRCNQWVMCPDYHQLPMEHLQKAPEEMEKREKHSSLWGNYKLRLCGFHPPFSGRSSLKTDQLTIHPVLLAQRDTLISTVHPLVLTAM